MMYAMYIPKCIIFSEILSPIDALISTTDSLRMKLRVIIHLYPSLILVYMISANKNPQIIYHIVYQCNGLAQDCSNSSALVMELLQSCTKPSICELLVIPADDKWYVTFRHKHLTCDNYFGTFDNISCNQSILGLMNDFNDSRKTTPKVIFSCLAILDYS